MIADLIQELRDAGTEYESIHHAWTLDEIDRLDGDMPFALFIPGGAKSDPSPQLPVRQRITEQYIVITICKWQQLKALRDQLYGVLLGYQHADIYTPLEHVSGETHRIAGDTVYWMDAFSTSYWMERTGPPNALRTIDHGYLELGGEDLP